MNILVRYRNGVVKTFSLTYAPGDEFQRNWREDRNGGRRKELCKLEGNNLSRDALKRGPFCCGRCLSPPREIPFEDAHGAYCDGGAVLLQDLFDKQLSYKYLRRLSYVNGVAYILTGIAANKSTATGQVIYVHTI
jgi:hypothetical protein